MLVASTKNSNISIKILQESFESHYSKHGLQMCG
uniref:Uncharacterized protein n=1 Tax=Arundo donax TaxID=35708 RepID=A0A0A9FGU3_ARUDO